MYLGGQYTWVQCQSIYCMYRELTSCLLNKSNGQNFIPSTLWHMPHGKKLLKIQYVCNLHIMRYFKYTQNNFLLLSENKSISHSPSAHNLDERPTEVSALLKWTERLCSCSWCEDLHTPISLGLISGLCNGEALMFWPIYFPTPYWNIQAVKLREEVWKSSGMYKHVYGHMTIPKFTPVPQVL